MRNIAFLGTHYALIRELPTNQQGIVYKAIIDYAMEGIEPKNLTGMPKAIFETTRQYWDTCRKQYENGAKGGRPKTQQQTENETQTQTHQITQIETQKQTHSETQTETLYNNNTNINNIYKKEINKEKRNTVLSDSELNSLIDNEFADKEVCKKFKEYSEMRKAMGKNKAIRTRATFNACVEKLRSYAKTTEEALEILNNSISNCYQGLFQLERQRKLPQKEAIPYAN